MELCLVILLVFGIYMDLFLLYLIFRFTKRGQKSTGRDKVLNKEVPCLLLVQN